MGQLVGVNQYLMIDIEVLRWMRFVKHQEQLRVEKRGREWENLGLKPEDCLECRDEYLKEHVSA